MKKISTLAYATILSSICVILFGTCKNKNEGFLQMSDTIKKHALVVGIERVDPNKHNGYSYTRGTWKAETDANKIVDILKKSNFDKIEYLPTKKATKGNISIKIEECAQGMKDGDLFLVYFRCHGIQIPDTFQIDEIDEKDEAIPVYDGLLIDDELQALFDKNFNYKINIVLLSDLCNSETIHSMFEIPPLQVYEKKDNPSTYNLLNIAAASDSKTAISWPSIKDRLRLGYGDFTDALLKAMKYDSLHNYIDLYNSIKPRMLKEANSASPTYTIVGDESFFLNNFNLTY